MPKILLSEVFTTLLLWHYSMLEKERGQMMDQIRKGKQGGKREKWAKQAELLLFVLEEAVALAFASSH